MVKNLNKSCKYVDNINTTHDMIAYLMILMNYYSARELKSHNTGIYRSAKLNYSYKPPESLPDEVGKFLKISLKKNSYSNMLHCIKKIKSNILDDSVEKKI